MIPSASFVIDAINQHLPPRRKKTNGGIGINCPMCIMRGERRPDTKFRCGVRFFPNGGVHINCFNCAFATRWYPGSRLTVKVGQFLQQLGAGPGEISKLKFVAWQLMQSVGPDNSIEFTPLFSPDFQPKSLPEGSLTLGTWAAHGLDDPDFLDVANYAFSRGDDVFKTTDFYWTPSTTHNMNRRLIIPYYWNGIIVGWTGRSIDKITPRYYTDTPAHFLFNNSSMNKNRKYVILVEGIFDALSIDGVASQGAKLSDQQAQWLKDSGKTIIVLPDADTSGQRLVDLALQHGWMVSFPQVSQVWDADIKDANDAVLRYGRLYVVKTIIDCATNGAMQINQYRRKMTNGNRKTTN